MGVKQWFINIFFFNNRRNSRFWRNDWNYIGNNNKIFHINKDVSSHRLSKIGWNAVINKRAYSVGYREIGYLYKSDVINVDKVTYKIIPPTFDYEAEIEYLRDEIWKEIVSKTIDAHSVVLERESGGVRRKYLNDDVRGKFSAFWDVQNQWKVWKLGEIQQYKYVVYTADPEQYKRLCQFSPVFYNKHGKKVDKMFLGILTNSKYLERLSNFYTYQQFLDSEMLKKLYYNQYYNNVKVNLSSINVWNNIHPMYEYKFKNFYSEKKKENNIPYDWRMYLEQKYPTKYIDVQNERLKDKISKYEETKLSSTTLKYQLLYKFSKNKLLKLQKQCKKLD